MYSIPVIWLGRPSVSGNTPIRGLISAGRSEPMPSMKNRPDVGRRIVVRIRIEVVFPAPFGPRNPMTWPARRLNERPCKAVQPR
jgi:hypothetical protein